MRKYGDKAFLEADKVLTGMVDKKQWLDNVVADANAKINVANQTIAKVGGTAGKLFGPIIDAAQMMAGAWQYQQTGESSDWENACAGVAASWAAAGLAVLLLPSAASVVTVSLVAAAAAGAGSYFGGQYFQDLKESLLSSSWFIDGVDAIAEAVNANFLAAKNWTPPRDPLVLDLDGDGIEAVGIAPSNPILFDHNGDGVKTATGWIKADDGILVLDRDGNGLIETGRELFGDTTVLEHGARAGQLAANGYEALADLDGNADGVLDSTDAAWGQLRVWRDQNQDGISQAGELHSLDALGIASLGVQGTQNRVDLGGGNTQTMSGGFTRSDGSTGASGVAEVSGNLLLAANNFYRYLTVAVMDNASIHHNIDQDILHQWMVRDRFVLLFLPPYSPELNLIEILWKQAKYHWREFVTWAAKDLRKEVQALSDGVGAKFNLSYA